MFYIKFIFDGLQLKLRTINYEALDSYSIIESVVDIRKEHEELLYV